MKRKKIKLFLLLFLILLPASLLDAEAHDEAATAQKQTPVLIDLDVKDVDIKEIARIISRVSGLNVVVSEDVEAKVTFKGANVDWETALSMILKTYGLTYVREGNFLRILSYAKLSQEEGGVPLTTKVVFLDFAKACDLATALGSVKSSRGRIDTNTKTNSLIITDTPAVIDKLLPIIKDLDKRTPQVMIEAMMVDIKLTNEDQLGIDWSLTHKDFLSTVRSFDQNLSANMSGGIIRYGKTLLPKANFAAIIDFWCKDERAEVLANPKVLTLDGLVAKIELVEQVPYTYASIESTTGAVTSTIGFKDAGIKLEVTPHISVGGFISLELKTEQSYRSGTASNGEPLIDARKAETNLLVRDGETIVIGGLKKRNTTTTINKLPLVGNIPFLGKLFQKRVYSSTDSELLIFVTPSIVTEAQLTTEEGKSLGKLKLEEKGRPLKKPSRESPFPLRPPSGVAAEYYQEKR